MVQDVDKLLKQAYKACLSDMDIAAVLFKQCADLGSSEAKFMLGNMYYQGNGKQQDYRKAMYYFTCAAQEGYSRANFILGDMYLHGKGCDKNTEKAARVWKAGYKNGSLECGYNLSGLYEHGIGVEQDIKKSLSILRDCAEQGLTAAKAKLEKSSISAKELTAEEINDLTEKAQAGDPSSAYKLGMAYMRGNGVEKDKETAAVLFLSAAKKDHFLATVALFNRFYMDSDNRTVWSAAEYWLKKAVILDTRRFGIVHPSLVTAYDLISNNDMNNEADAQDLVGLGWYGAYVALGDIYENTDPAKSLEQYQNGANKGDATAFLRLYDVYSNESSEYHDAKKAMQMLEEYEQIASLLKSFDE